MVEAPDVDAASSGVRKQWCNKGAWPAKSRRVDRGEIAVISVGRSGVNSQTFVERRPKRAIRSRWACVCNSGLSFEVIAETMST